MRKKIASNFNIDDDINVRIFESAGVDDLVLTSYAPNFKKLFIFNKSVIANSHPTSAK